MEDLKNPEVQTWFAGQNDYTRALLASIPGRAQLLARIHELDQSVPQVLVQRWARGLYIIWKRLPAEDIFKAYLRRGRNGQDRLLVDPEKIALTPANQGKGKNDVPRTRAPQETRRALPQQNEFRFRFEKSARSPPATRVSSAGAVDSPPLPYPR